MQKNIKILIVDDDVDLIQSMIRELRKKYEIHTAHDGEEALATVEKQGPFAVIVSDLMMPKMDGSSLLERMAETHPWTSRIMMTGRMDTPSINHAINKGQVFRFLAKPFNKSMITKAIDEGINQYEGTQNQEISLDKIDRPVGFDRDIEKLDAGISLLCHELRTPLNHIIGFSEILQSSGFIPPAQSSFMDAIVTSGDLMLQRVNQVLYYWMLIHDAVELDLDPQKLQNMAIRCKKYIQDHSQEHPREVKIQEEIDQSVYVLADWKWIWIACTELVDNSIKFSEDNSDITISIACANKTATISLENNYTALAESTVENIRKPFIQGEDFMTRRMDGLGLGLTIADKIINLHNGVLDIQNNAEKKQILITIELPITKLQ